MLGAAVFQPPLLPPLLVEVGRVEPGFECRFAAGPLAVQHREPRCVAVLAFDQGSGASVVNFRLTLESARDFARFTQENVGRKVAVRVDRKTLTEVVIREPILGGGFGQLTVSNAEEGRNLATRLSDGSAVLEMEPIGN